MIHRCQCGAYTVNIGDNSISMPKHEFQRNFPNQIASFVTYNCNYCVNHWGTDLCSCGSGLHPEECCNEGAYQNLSYDQNNTKRISQQDSVFIEVT